MPERAISAHTQLVAVAWLRWRIFVNAFRRRTRKRSVAGWVFSILLRMIVWPVIALFVVGCAVGGGFLSWTAISHGHPQNLLQVLAGISIVWQFVSLNGMSIAAAASSFDPSSLLRFPLPFGRYLLLRMLLGLATPSTIFGCLALLGAAIGIGVADHSLALPALVVLLVYACMNVFFTRMLGAWIERWLAARRAREILGVLTALFFVGVQLLNFQVQSQGVRGSWLTNFLQASAPFFDWLPPGFAANAILLKGHPVAALAQFAALLGWTALFLAVFAMRLYKEFLGEYLSEGAARRAPAAPAVRARPVPLPASPRRAETFFAPVIAACLRKEWMSFRSSPHQFTAMLTPLLLSFVIGKRIFASHPTFFLPGVVGYVLFFSLFGLYNIFSADGPGVQLYLLAPIRLRDVILAKNIASLIQIAVVVMLAWGLVLTLSSAPIPLSRQVSAALWIIFVMGANLTVGTLRSIQAPRRLTPGQAQQTRTATSRTSSILILALFFGSFLLQIPVALLSRNSGQPWLAAEIFAPLAAAAIMAYALLLRKADKLILTHRDLLAEELCK